MAAKFISFLGTTSYMECSYYFENYELENYPTRFVQVSLIRRLILDSLIEKNTKIFVLATDAAKNINWLDGRNRDGKHQTGLQTSLSNLKWELESAGKCVPPYNTVEIPEGKNRDELWQIFNCMVDLVEEGDRVYFDITHSFRSLPMLALVVLNYLRVVKNITIEKIFYGAFEAKISINNFNHVPIFDLSPFVELMEWTTAVNLFNISGDPRLINQLATRTVNKELRLTKGENIDARYIKDFSNALSKFNNSLNTLRGKSLPEEYYELNKLVSEAKMHFKGLDLEPLEKSFELLEENFQSAQTVKNFDRENLEAIIKNLNLIIKYCFKFDKIQIAFTLLEENVTNYCCYLLDLDVLNRLHRKLVGDMLLNKYQNDVNTSKNLPLKPFKFDDFEDLDSNLVKTVNSFIQKTELYGLEKIQSKLKQLRNDLNHAGFNDTPAKDATFKNEGPKLLEQFENCIKSLSQL
jgi:CRISPR-associated Csx2 family protein